MNSIKIMRQLLIAILLSIPLLTRGQAESDVSVTDLIGEIQQWNKQGNKMSLAWWIPSEYWRIALKDRNDIPPETIAHFEKVFDDYMMIWACDLTINLDGTLTFTAEQEIGKSISVVDRNDNEHFPLAKEEILVEVLTIAETMKPVFAQALGQMGQGLHYYFFNVRDENGKSLVDAKRHGTFKILHSNSEFLWKLPLATLMPPKFCPLDREKMNGTWKYCPLHGNALGN